jgi:hypothetical protein
MVGDLVGALVGALVGDLVGDLVVVPNAAQVSDTASLVPQFSLEERRQLTMDVSEPVHLTSS